MGRSNRSESLSFIVVSFVIAPHDIRSSTSDRVWDGPVPDDSRYHRDWERIYVHLAETFMGCCEADLVEHRIGVRHECNFVHTLTLTDIHRFDPL